MQKDLIDTFQEGTLKIKDEYKVSIANQTFIENQVSAISQNFLKQCGDKKAFSESMNTDRMEMLMNENIAKSIRDVAKRIQLELYNVSRCVDDGNFIKKIENRVPLQLDVQ